MKPARLIDPRRIAKARSLCLADAARAMVERNEAVRLLRRKGVPDREIAEALNIGITTVGKIHPKRYRVGK